MASQRGQIKTVLLDPGRGQTRGRAIQELATLIIELDRLLARLIQSADSRDNGLMIVVDLAAGTKDRVLDILKLSRIRMGSVRRRNRQQRRFAVHAGQHVAKLIVA